MIFNVSYKLFTMNLDDFYNNINIYLNNKNNNNDICNFTNKKIKDNDIFLSFKDGTNYLLDNLKIFLEINLINNNIIEYDTYFKLNMKNNNTIYFYKNLDKTFMEIFLKQNNFNDIKIYKYIITPPNNNIKELKPYIPVNNMKKIKKSFNHGNIVFTGINYYILKELENNKKVWKELLYDDHFNIIVPYEYLQSNTYTYYIKTIKNLSMLSLDIDNSVYLDHKINYIYPEPFNEYEYLNEDDYNEYEKKIMYNGYMKLENDIFYINNNSTWNKIIDNFIPNEYINIKGISYYIKIAQEFETNFKTLISATELLDLLTFNIKIIDI